MLSIEQGSDANQTTISGNSMMGVFEKSGGTFVILGEPGSGKTTALLGLGRELIARAERDEAYPVPVVFVLANWAEKRQALSDWIVDELSRRYSIPKKQGRIWIADDLIIPLLDGLDEVKIEHREACAHAINEFRADHGLVPIIVSCRTVDYIALTTRLRFPTVVELQRLATQNVDAHLARFGNNLSVRHNKQRQGGEFNQFASNPTRIRQVASTPSIYVGPEVSFCARSVSRNLLLTSEKRSKCVRKPYEASSHQRFARFSHCPFVHRLTIN